MKSKVKILLALLMLVAICNIYSIKHELAPSPKNDTEVFFKNGLEQTLASLDDLKMAANTGNKKKITLSYLKAKISYKKIEFLCEYYYPYLSRQINGPALPFSDGENSYEVLEPEGFQVIEELTLPFEKSNKNELIKQIDLLGSRFQSILDQTYPLGFQDKFIFEAMRYEVYRIIAQGVSGFDSPVSLNSLNEAVASFDGLTACISFFPVKDEDNKNIKNDLLNTVQKAKDYLNKHSNFNKFDRLSFIYNLANPISTKLLTFQKHLDIDIEQGVKRINTNASSLFNMESFNPNLYSPNNESAATPQRIALGKKLFSDPILSGNNKTSCASCHNPTLAFTDGLTKSVAIDGKSTTERNAPTLLNAAFQPKQFYDSRAIFLEDQVFDVVHNAKEMGGSLEKAVNLLNNDKNYKVLFKKAYTNQKAFSYQESITIEDVTNAVASYIRSLVSFDSRFDHYMKGKTSALSVAEQHGFNLFMGKAKCGTCHYVPFFNGVAPPYFVESESEILGVPDVNDKKRAKLDADMGKYNLYKISNLVHSFKTPTLRNIELTAPYMHNGVFKTLEEVVDFYNDGGGIGWGIGPENQTLGSDPLKLTKKEKQELIAFLKSLTGTESIKSN